jgi:predicted  nucleic acid-binding Zn-ribbon protein
MGVSTSVYSIMKEFEEISNRINDLEDHLKETLKDLEKLVNNVSVLKNNVIENEKQRHL